MVRYWVIDASVIGVANHTGREQSANAVQFLERLRNMPDRIVLNSGIQSEYWRRRNESPGGQGTLWWHSIRQSDRFEFESEQLPDEIEQELRARQFDSDDDKYVAAALAVSTGDADDPTMCIVQEDREDFEKIEDLLSREGVRLANTEQAIEIIDMDGKHA